MMTKHEELKMRVTYEPNRHSVTHIMDAYETLLPTINRIINDASVCEKNRKSSMTLGYKGEKL